MSDDYPPSTPVPLMNAAKALDLGRAHQGWAAYLRDQGLPTEARIAERQAQWWIGYSIALAATHSEDR